MLVLVFLLGLITGGTTGMLMMCLVQGASKLSYEDDDENIADQIENHTEDDTEDRWHE
ncbi:MAG: hypothetical protein ACI4CX_00060 [Candidatus Weimeria sp.]